ncbi:hypothetical protein KP509_05G018000 [Ceratopteris richardii]|uniref:F-box domain-containing protein n=1 Tax=Ceratopteris richardii TaxID=49495 RepID=A0A8T2UJP9_CERRI|nr:hypothetical protein KP509_05G018000 [Ceratopteris richardii]
MVEAAAMATQCLIAGLPDEVSLLCLARISLALHPVASCVSRAWRDALKSSVLYDLRERVGLQEHRIFIFAPSKRGLLSRRLTQFYLIDPILLKCRPLPPPPFLGGYPQRFYCDVLSLGRQVSVVRMCCGSFSDCPEDVFCFDVVCGVWCMPPPSMLEPRTSFASACVDGYVYAAGGEAGRDCVRLKSAERFNLLNKQWEKIADMKNERYRAAGVALKGSFCVLGGYEMIREGIFTMYDSAEVWDPSKEEWKFMPTMWRHDMRRGAAVKGKLYGIRYCRGKEMVWYNEDQNQWLRLGSLPETLQGNTEDNLIGVGDHLWMMIKDANRKCSFFSTNPEKLPLTWTPLPFLFENYPSNFCVVTL